MKCYSKLLYLLVVYHSPLKCYTKIINNSPKTKSNMLKNLASNVLSIDNQCITPQPFIAHVSPFDYTVLVMYHGSDHVDRIPLTPFNQWLESTGKLKFPLEHIDLETGETTHYSGELTIDEFYEIYSGRELAIMAHEYLNQQ